MYGHIRKRRRSDGTTAWQVRFPDGGRERLKTFGRKVDAQRWLADRQAAALRGDLISPEAQAVTFAGLAEDWRSSWAGRLQPRTMARYDEVLRVHLLPEFGGRMAHQIGPVDVQRYIGWLSGRAAPGTIRKIHSVLSACYSEGMRLGTVRANPARGVRLPRVPAREMTFLTAGEVEALASTAGALPAPGGPMTALAIRLATYTGLRAGEQWAIRVRDVDLLHRRIQITRALKDIGGRHEFGPTKTHQARAVVFPRALVPALTIQMRGRAPDDLLFTGAYGAPIRHNLFALRVFRPAVLLGLPESKRALRWHDLRHTYASLAAMAGAQPKDVQAQLGHASIMMTLDRYTHLFPAQADALADRLDGLIGGEEASAA
jgi:integrase